MVRIAVKTYLALIERFRFMTSTGKFTISHFYLPLLSKIAGQIQERIGQQLQPAPLIQHTDLGTVRLLTYLSEGMIPKTLCRTHQIMIFDMAYFFRTLIGITQSKFLFHSTK